MYQIQTSVSHVISHKIFRGICQKVGLSLIQQNLFELDSVYSLYATSIQTPGLFFGTPGIFVNSPARMGVIRDTVPCRLQTHVKVLSLDSLQ